MSDADGKGGDDVLAAFNAAFVAEPSQGPGVDDALDAFRAADGMGLATRRLPGSVNERR